MTSSVLNQPISDEQDTTLERVQHSDGFQSIHNTRGQSGEDLCNGKAPKHVLLNKPTTVAHHSPSVYSTRTVPLPFIQHSNIAMVHAPFTDHQHDDSPIKQDYFPACKADYRTTKELRLPSHQSFYTHSSQGGRPRRFLLPSSHCHKQRSV